MTPSPASGDGVVAVPDRHSRCSSRWSPWPAAARRGTSARRPTPGPSSPLARTTGAVGRAAEPDRARGQGPARARLDAEHEPHRVLRRGRERLVRRRGDRPRDPAVRDHDPRGAHGRRPGRVRDQLPGRADLRRGGRRAGRLGDGHPPAHRAARSPSSPTPTIQRPRDLDGKTYAGFGYPNEVPTLQVGDQGRRRDRRLHDGDPRHAPPTRRSTRSGRTSTIPFTRLGGRRGRRSAGSTCATSSSATTGSPTSTRSSSPAIAAGSSASRTSRDGSWLRRSAASRSPPTDPEPARAAPRRARTRASSTGTPTLPAASQALPRRARLPPRRAGRRRTADPGALERPTPASCTSRAC